jgi:hypothetical protein
MVSRDVKRHPDTQEKTLEKAPKPLTVINGGSVQAFRAWELQGYDCIGRSDCDYCLLTNSAGRIRLSVCYSLEMAVEGRSIIKY